MLSIKKFKNSGQNRPFFSFFFFIRSYFPFFFRCFKTQAFLNATENWIFEGKCLFCDLCQFALWTQLIRFTDGIFKECMGIPSSQLYLHCFMITLNLCFLVYICMFSLRNTLIASISFSLKNWMQGNPFSNFGLTLLGKKSYLIYTITLN